MDEDAYRDMADALREFADDLADDGQLEDPAQVTAAEAWQKAKEKYPVGSIARGVVKARFNFGVFLELQEAPAVKGFVDIVSYNPGGETPVALPDVGETVEGTVVSLVDRDQQIRLRVGPAPWGAP
ncbi:hypothetical protein ACH44C_14035 [Streptomyces purpureus]|uniref:hypothetical protein n=1 Tax=Streptomyces purpureus TaxID=1951 RepID=UPI0037A6C27F